VNARVAGRVAGIEESATYVVLEMVQALRAQGVSVLDLGGGEPDFATAGHIVAEAAAAMEEGFTHYSPSRGLPALREAIADKLRADNGIDVDPRTDVIVTPSAKHALFISLMTLLDTGDEILVPTPSWVSYASMAELLGARAVPVPLRGDEGFRVGYERLAPYVTDRTRAILVNTPNNPTGRALRADEAAELASFAIDHDLVIVTDEIYEKIRYDGVPHVSLASLPGCAERTLTVNGFSKAYAMTGWRLGYVAGPTDIVAEMVKAQQHTVGCAGSFVQRGAIAALRSSQDFVHEMVEEYAARRRLVVDGLNALPGISCAPPDGSFYAFPDIRGTGVDDSAAFTAWLLREAGVAVTPGVAFGPGGEGHVRLSFATSQAVIGEALDRMAAALAKGAPTAALSG
jgi:aspartate aminotransferase